MRPILNFTSFAVFGEINQLLSAFDVEE